MLGFQSQHRAHAGGEARAPKPLPHPQQTYTHTHTYFWATQSIRCTFDLLTYPWPDDEKLTKSCNLQNFQLHLQYCHLRASSFKISQGEHAPGSHKLWMLTHLSLPPLHSQWYGVFVPTLRTPLFTAKCSKVLPSSSTFTRNFSISSPRSLTGMWDHWLKIRVICWTVAK